MEVRQEEYRKADVIKQKLAKESKGEDDIDVEDIKQIAETSEMGGSQWISLNLSLSACQNQTLKKEGDGDTNVPVDHFCSLNRQTRIHGIPEFLINNLN